MNGQVSASTGAILIVGGSGSLGRATARRLLMRGNRVRILTRFPGKLEDLRTEAAEILRGDLLDTPSLAAACKGVDQVFAAAHSILGRGRESSVHVDDRGHRDLLSAAREAGVRRFVYTSAFAHGSSVGVPFFRIKREIEGAVASSGMVYTILRPTAFMEPHAHTLIGLPVVREGKVTIFGRGETPRNFVAPEDVARVAEIALADGLLDGESVDIGGPENLTTMDVIHLYEKLSGRQARVRHLPLALPRLLAPIFRPIHPGVSQILSFTALSDEDQSFDSGPMSVRFSFEPMRLDHWAAERLGARADDVDSTG